MKLPTSLNYERFSAIDTLTTEQASRLNIIDILHQEKTLVNQKSPFIVANTTQVSLGHLKNDCIIPVFSKDNEKTISHQEFVDVTLDTVYKKFSEHMLDAPEIRVSHQIKGRTPNAIHKPVNQLLDSEKTVYYERMAFIVRIPTYTSVINGNTLSLTIGGVRSYNQENLYNKKTLEKFKVFIGFQNMVCCNLCASTDGAMVELKVTCLEQLAEQITALINNYDAEQHLQQMMKLTKFSLSEEQFAQVIGKSRLYQHVPKTLKKNIPELSFSDSQLYSVAKDFYDDDNFAVKKDKTIDLWSMYNLFTHANKSTYIDKFIERNTNALDLTLGLADALENKESEYAWFLK